MVNGVTFTTIPRTSESTLDHETQNSASLYSRWTRHLHKHIRALSQSFINKPIILGSQLHRSSHTDPYYRDLDNKLTSHIESPGLDLGNLGLTDALSRPLNCAVRIKMSLTA